MLIAPKGLEYWIDDKDGNSIIDPKAPDWAKKEFKEYMRLMDKSSKPDKNGNVTNY